MSEEVGEVARAIHVRKIGRDRPDETDKPSNELLENLEEELVDVLDNIFILADKYDISLDSIINTHKQKLENRFKSH